MAATSPYSNKSYHNMGADPRGTERTDVRVRPDKSHRGDYTVRIKGVDDDAGDDEGGPWGARGPLWFLIRLLVLVMCITITATRSWAIGGPRYVNIIMKIDGIGDVSDRAYIDWSEIGLVTACYKAVASSAVVGPLDGVECDSVGSKWNETPWTVALVFAVIFIVTLGVRLTLEAAELFNPGCLPVQLQNLCYLRCLRHWTWIVMLIPWACFLGHWRNDKFDPLDIDYPEITDLHWGFWTWLCLWILWMIKVIGIEIGRL
eukprot:TRINITY_DN3756_c5_g1_i1.p1 TRINITY_DN3756_c5_g1~~TRINITY_DN3756_c5_g1_i1.p1  ORF type:complete len:282 (+),score=71.36 TRINITY_DN3756_c5_g1_i1:67-846(+)